MYRKWYLNGIPQNREGEVIEIMVAPYSQEQVTEIVRRNAKNEGEREGRQKGRREGRAEGITLGANRTAKNLAGLGIKPEQIALAVEMDVDTVRKWLSEQN